MTDIVERLRFHPADEDEVYGLFNEAADEIERMRRQLSRHEWAESADRALMEEEIEHQRERITWLQEQIEDLQKEKT